MDSLNQIKVLDANHVLNKSCADWLSTMVLLGLVDDHRGSQRVCDRKVTLMTEIQVERARTTRRAIKASLGELLTFERLLADLSACVANVPGDQVEREIESALKRLLEFLDFDRSNFVELTADGQFTILCSVAIDGVERYPLGPAPAFLTWYARQLVAGNIIHVRSIRDLPPEAVGETEYYRRSGIQTSVGIPLHVGGRTFGAINFSAFHATRKWPDDLIARLKIVGEVMAQAIARRRSELALQASEERWRSMFEASNLGIAMLDQSLRYVATNSAFQAILGYTENELQQLTPPDVTAEEDRDETASRLTQLQQGKQQHYEAVKQYRRKDGAMIWGHTYVSAVRGTGFKPRMFIGTVIDVTETKQAQVALRATQSKLARITRLTTMHELTASIAHEVNQPLAAIVANGSAALRFLSAPTPDLEVVRQAVNSIVVDGHRAAEVIESIRATFKKIDQERAAVDINKLIRDVLVLMEVQAHGVSVKTELNNKLSDVVGNRVQLQQVIVNLITNAIDAMNTVINRPRVLQLRAESHISGGVLVSVEDSGAGIDPKDAERIFDTFFTTKSQGMGMGLSICRSIIEAHQGQLWVSSSNDHGSVFNIHLPSLKTGQPTLKGSRTQRPLEMH
jgi:PAS domain S-box-containing protein